MTASGRRILITGGAGFIGLHLASQLALDARNDILLLDNHSRGPRDPALVALTQRANITMMAADIMTDDLAELLPTQFDEVYHLAAVVGVDNVIGRPDTVLAVNGLGTIRVLEWFVHSASRKMIFSSTSEVYSWTQQFHELPIPTPEDVPLSITDPSTPRIAYAASKVFGEVAVHQFCKTFDKEFTVLRYHNVYGPRMGYSHVIPELCERAISGENPLVVYSTSHSRAFCFVSDAIDATILAMRQRSADGQIINVGNDEEEITIGNLANLILATLKIKIATEGRSADNDPINRRCPDVSKARALLGYAPSVSLAEGLRTTLEWYAGEGRRPVSAVKLSPR